MNWSMRKRMGMEDWGEGGRRGDGEWVGMGSVAPPYSVVGGKWDGMGWEQQGGGEVGWMDGWMGR